MNDLINGSLSMTTSLRNHVKGKVKEIVEGPAVSEVEIETSAGTLSSVITTRSLKQLALKVGDEVSAVVKSTEVGIEKP
jgi:molybdopterin-binding protein